MTATDNSMSLKAAADPRAVAFCSQAGPDVFGGVVHGSQIWSADPFDVESVHADARSTFIRLLDRAGSSEPPAYGQSLLLLGDAGSGKTHLMRAFRTTAHTDGTGYCGYLQMRSRTDHYARYLLSNLVSSLEQPYRPGSPETGLHRLARGLLDALDVVPIEDRNRLCDDLLEPDEAAVLVLRFADIAAQYPRFRAIDVNILRALLFTLANDGRVRPRVLNWLRCEDLSRFDRDLIGDLVPRPQPEKPMETILDLGRLIHAVHNAALVLLVDQIDQALELDRPGEDPGEQFRAAIGTLLEITDNLPTAVVVIGCLSDLFAIGKQKLHGWMLARLEHDPESIRLHDRPTSEQITEIVARRLDWFYDDADLPAVPVNRLYPFTQSDLATLAGQQTRVLLENLHRHRRNCIAAGKLVPFITVTPPPPSVSSTDWELRWNDHLSAYKAAILDDESDLAELLTFAIRSVSEEVTTGCHFAADPDGRFIPVEIHTGNAVDRLLVAICDKSSRGGGLANQIAEVTKRAGDLPAVFVRSTGFPTTPSAAVSKELAKWVAPRGKGRKVVVENSDWRAMAAFRDFHNRHHAEPGFAAWQRSDRPLSDLRAIHVILALDRLALPPTAEPPPPPLPPAGLPKLTPAAPEPMPTTGSSATLRLGQTRGAAPTVVEFQPLEFCRHAAFLGGSGSGKTTAALTLIEQLLLAGVPAILIDRKGDLSRYADPDAWDEPESDTDRAARRSMFRDGVDVALFTPGSTSGRPLAIPVVPPDLGTLPTAERATMTEQAAANLGRMMGYNSRSLDPKVVILQTAIELLSRTGPGPITVSSLQQLVRDRDDALIGSFEGYEDKHFKKLAENLLTLSYQHRRLLEEGEPLNVDALLGRSPDRVPGRTRLSIINTQFLGDEGAVDFWLAQFLLCVKRWREQHPASDRLQCVLLFDEADRYLPAVGKPATKAPLEDLLRRGRSAGIGVFLASQSPGDFDYRCRDQVLTWLIGRVKEPVAITKLKPMLDSARVDAASRLPGQETGQFYLVRESAVTAITADRNLLPTSQLPEDRILTLAQAQKCR